jgi:hypothetical protein
MSATTLLPGFVENVDRRVLGAFRCADSITGASIQAPLVVSSPVLKIRQNHSGIWVIFNGPGFALVTDDFLPSGSYPPSAPFVITIQDPSGTYLSRQATLNVPPPLTPVSDPASMFNPRTIVLYGTAGLPIGQNWAVVRASVTRSGITPPEGLGNALVQVTRTSDSALLATGMTDKRGEALVAVQGIGVRASSNASGAVLEATTAVTVRAFFDATILTQPAGWVPDPDQLLGNVGGASIKTAAPQAVQLGAGLSISVSFSISV